MRKPPGRYSAALYRHLSERGALSDFAVQLEDELGHQVEESEAVRRTSHKWSITAGRRIPIEGIGPALRVVGSLGDEFNELMLEDIEAGRLALLEAENKKLREELRKARPVRRGRSRLRDVG